MLYMFLRKRKLNNKGFTLIELLAVIVILALVVGITIPSVLSSMNNSRISTLHTNAVSFANWYNETVAQDELLPSDEKTISVDTTTTLSQNNGTWYCLNSGDLKDDLVSKYDLSETNFKTDGNAPSNSGNVPVVSKNTCSAIRSNNGEIEVLLIAKNTGRYNVSKYQVTYAISSEDNGCTGATNACKDIE